MNFPILLIFLLPITMMNMATAATIRWEPPVLISSADDVSTDGTLVEAFNAAISGDREFSPTVNGVFFTRTQELLASDFGQEQPTPLYPFDTGDSGYNALLNSIDFGSSMAAIETGGGFLGEGEMYLLQVWYVDQRTNSSSFVDRRIVFGDENGLSSGPMNGHYIIGTFTADGPTQTLLAGVVEGANYGPQITAYQLRLIPEPGSVALFALGLVGLLIRRKRL